MFINPISANNVITMLYLGFGCPHHINQVIQLSNQHTQKLITAPSVACFHNCIEGQENCSLDAFTQMALTSPENVLLL